MARARLGDLRQRLVDLVDRLHPANPDAHRRLGDRPAEEVMDAIEQAAVAAAGREAALAMQLERLKAATSHLGDGIVVCDGDGEIVFRNTKAEAYAGARHGDALAERALVDLLGRAIRGEECAEPLDLWGPPRRTLQLSARPLFSSAGLDIVGAVALVEDVSEKRRLDSVRRDFVANISHELKTPVGALGLLADAIMEEDDLVTIRRLASRFQLESERLGRIIEDLLDLSRIEAQERPPHIAIPVHSLVNEAVERILTRAEHLKVHITVGEHDRRFTVIGDRRDLVSAIHNLLENAVKYSDEGGEVSVDVGQAVTGPTSVRHVIGGVAIRVSDRGIGIPARDLERIFERFYRVDRARARDTGGTGLGLSIVRHVAHNHGGDVAVSSREGEGSCFSLVLPLGPLTQASLFDAVETTAPNRSGDHSG